MFEIRFETSDCEPPTKMRAKARRVKNGISLCLSMTRKEGGLLLLPWGVLARTLSHGFAERNGRTAEKHIEFDRVSYGSQPPGFASHGCLNLRKTAQVECSAPFSSHALFALFSHRACSASCYPRSPSPRKRCGCDPFAAIIGFSPVI